MNKALNPLLIVFFIPLLMTAQTRPARILGTFQFSGNIYNYDFAKLSPDRFTFNISGSPDSTLSNNPDSTETTNAESTAFSSFEIETFIPLFTGQMKTKYNISDSDTLKNKARDVFYSIKARLEFIDDEPVTAYLILRKNVIVSFLRSNSAQSYDGRLSYLYIRHHIESVSVETESGAIKNITVHLVHPKLAGQNIQSPRQYLEFKNQYPISISGKFDPEKFANINLYSFNTNGIKGLTRYIKLSDLLSLDIVLENEKEDYSPSNRTVMLSPNNPIVELKKEKRSRILEIAAFSDLIGLDQEEPNGLIQIEAKRKININTKSHLVHATKSEEITSKVDFEDIIFAKAINQSKKFTTYAVQLRGSPRVKFDDLFNDAEKNLLKQNTPDAALKSKLKENNWMTFTTRNNRFRSPYYTLFGNVEPKLLFSKLEQNNRVIDSLSLKDKAVNPLQLYQYQLASLGITMNVLKFNFPQLKFSWTPIYVGYYWFRTRIGSAIDSVNEHSIALNSDYWHLGSQVNFLPDSRWGFALGIDYMKVNLWNEEYRLANNNGLWQYSVDAYLKTNDNSKLFFRFRRTHEHHFRENNFTQLQLGYSMNLFVGPSEENNK